MTLTSPPVSVAPFESGRLAAGISASATTITVSPIFKTVNGVRTKQGFDTTSGIAIISQGDFAERISFEGSSVDATTKVTTLTTCVRGLSVTSTTASFAGGTGRIWPKGAKITLVADISYFQSVPFKNVANTFTGIQTFGAGGAVRFSGTDTSGLRVKSLTTAERDALTPANGDFIYNTTTGVMNQYIAGAWAAIGTDATANASSTVAGKVEIATAAQRAASTATGETGALLVPSNDALVKTSSGAGDENKIPVLGSSGTMAVGFLGTGSPSSSNYLLGSGAFGTVTIPANLLFGDGSDGTPTWTSGASLDPATEKRYTTATLPVSQTLTVSTVNVPLVIHNTGDVTINGTVDLNATGAAGGLGGQTNGSNGSNGTAGASLVSGWTAGAGAGGPVGGGAGGGGGGASSLAAGTAGGQSGGAAGTIVSANQLAILSSLMRGVVCGAGGGGGYSLSTGRGGAGKEGGGALLWMIGGNLTLGAASVIRANGVTGQAGISGTGGGGGGGGGGTILILVAGTITNGGVTVSATAGSGGANIGGGGDGGAGAAGKVIIYSLSTGTLITA